MLLIAYSLAVASYILFRAYYFAKLPAIDKAQFTAFVFLSIALVLAGLLLYFTGVRG